MLTTKWDATGHSLCDQIKENRHTWALLHFLWYRWSKKREKEEHWRVQQALGAQARRDTAARITEAKARGDLEKFAGLGAKPPEDNG